MHFSLTRKTILAFLGIALISSFSFFAYAEELPSGSLTSTEWITSGAKLEKWDWKTTTGNVKINLIEVDLKNPYIKVDAIYGKNGQTGAKQNIKNMATESGAVAAINGDFFTLTAEGASFGTTIQNGEMINSPGYIFAKNAFMIDSNNVPAIERLNFEGSVTAENSTSFQLFGINKTQYQAGYLYTGNSHQNRLHMYTDKWNMNNWVGDNLDQYTVVLVENGIATKKVNNSKLSIPAGGYLLLGHGDAAKFLQDNINIGEKVDISYSLAPDNLVTAIDGSTLLVNDGAKAKIEYEIKGNHARTAVGYSQDKRYIYLVTVEKSDNSVGMTLDELSTFLLNRGIWKAVNLDGGGSTTMVARPLGQFGLTDITTPAYNVEREVPNGLAIYSTAPKGKLKNMDFSVPQAILVSEKVQPILKNAYDEYYNPIKMSDIDLKWTYPDNVTFADGAFSFSKPGTYTLKASSGEISKEYQIKVYDKSEIAKLKINKEIVRMHVGEETKLILAIEFKDGYKRNLSSNAVTWSLIGANATVQTDGTIKALGRSKGSLIASFQGFSTAIPIDIGGSNENVLIDSFENKGIYLLTGLTKTETSTIAIVEEGSRKYAKFNYDFGSSQDIRIAYMQYGTNGKYLGGEPARLTLDVLGDNSGHWLRTEIRDANNKIYYINFAQKIDWEGWKTVEAILPSTMAYPVTIKSIYVVHLENSKDSTRNYGELGFDNLQVYDWSKTAVENRTSLTFTLNQEKVVVDGNETKTLDQAPIVVDGRTFLPVRHITELLGGTITYNQADKRIDIIKDYKIYNLWLDDKVMSVNGEARQLEVAPFVSNGRTMLPLRDISEAFGLYVSYDIKTKTITIK